MNKDIDIHFRVDNEEKEVIDKAAKAVGMTRSEYVRSIVLSASDYEVTDITYAHEKPLQDDSSKTKDIHIRFSEAELIYYVEQAKAAGCTMSEYIRRSANGNDIYVIDGLPELTKQIAKLGVNINQLTVLAHQGKIKEVDLFPCNDTLKQILKELLKLTKKKG